MENTYTDEQKLSAIALFVYMVVRPSADPYKFDVEDGIALGYWSQGEIVYGSDIGYAQSDLRGIVQEIAQEVLLKLI